MTLSLVVAAALLGMATASPLVAGKLRCEWKTDPLAVDTDAPRLTWIAEGDGYDRQVTAVQVLVATSPDILEPGKADLWDSGKMPGAQFATAYEGKKLKPGQAAYWRLRVWDESDKPGRWSRVAEWRKGIEGMWNADWIQDPDVTLPPMPPSMEGANWVGFPGDGGDPKAPGFFRHYRVTVKSGASKMLIAADDHFEAKVGSATVAKGGFSRYEVVDVSKFSSGDFTVDVDVVNDQGASGLLVKFVDASEQEVAHEPVQVAKRAGGPWVEAAKVVEYGGAPWGKVRPQIDYPMGPAAMIRHAFRVDKPVKQAVLYATALGLYQVSLNGVEVAGKGLAPGWTEFTKRLYYNAHDVTKQVKRGDNVIGSWLGDGWYAGYLGFTGQRFYYGGAPALRLELHITYRDGSEKTIGTGPDWRVAHGETTHADLLMGCAQDYRLSKPGWDKSGFDADGWKSPKVVEPPKVVLRAHPGSEVNEQGTIRAKSRHESSRGVWVYDFGQNFSGYVRFKATGKKGDKVTVRHGERLDKGALYTVNLRSAKATDTYVLGHDGETVCEPRFTFHGFQYCEISGLADPPEPQDVEGVVLHSDLPDAGTFTSSEPLLDRLVLNSDWSQLGNYLDVPTDCPQRDERAGWTGDAQVYMKSAYFNRDIAAFADKWLVDLCEDSPSPVDGAFPDVAPYLRVVGRGNAGWDDAGVVCVYQTWHMTGDTSPIDDHWAALDKCCDYWKSKATDYIRPPGAYGDWLLLDGLQHSPCLATALWVRDLRFMAEMAKATGRDPSKYIETRAKVRDAWRKAFLKPDSRIIDGDVEDQSMYAVALETGVLEESEAKPAADRLAGLIKKRGGHLATGFLGTPEVLKALADNGHTDVAYGALLKKDFPSWLYQVKLGATTMWERWDGWTPEKGFQDPGMNSFNHYWLGCVNEWLYTYAAGIDTSGAGWGEIKFKPFLTDQLSHVSASYESVRGRVSSSWRRASDGTVEIKLYVPVGSQASVELPPDAKVTHGPGSLEGGKGTVGSGDHTFLVPAPL